MHTMFLKLICTVCFILVLEDGLNMINNQQQQHKHNLFPPSVEAGFSLRGILSKIFKKARPPSNRRKADQASENLDQANDIAREIAEKKRSREERERKEHEQRRSREKATRDERRMENRGRNRNRNNGSGRDRSREKANRDRERLDRGK